MNDKEKKKVGNRIKQIRVSKGDTLNDFGIRIGRVLNVPKEESPSKSNVSKWERGISLPNKTRLKAIADIGEITVDELLYGKGQSYFKKLIDYIKKYCEENDVEFIAEEALFVAQDHAIFSHDENGKLLYEPPKSFSDIDLKEVIEDYHYQLDVFVGSLTKEQKIMAYEWAYKYKIDEFENNRSNMTEKEVDTLMKLDRYLDKK